MCSRNLLSSNESPFTAKEERLPDASEDSTHACTDCNDLHGPILVDRKVTKFERLNASADRITTRTSLSRNYIIGLWFRVENLA